MCQSCTVKMNNTQSDEFARTMIGHLNSAAVVLMCSIGYRTGLFEAMKTSGPATSADIAKTAQLNERYVREWLAAMVTARLVTYDPASKTYTLPEEHAAWLTRGSEQGNMAVTAQWLAEMAFVEDKIVSCFQTGGGIRYEDMRRFHDVMADESDQTVVSALSSHLLPLMKGMKQRLEAGITVLDVGCGRGHALIQLAQEFPRSRFVGYDLYPAAVERASAEAQAKHLNNVRFLKKDARDIREPARYDLIFTFDAVHDQAAPDTVLKNIYEALKSDGTYFCQDIAGSSFLERNMDHPLAPFLYTISTTSCMSVSLGQNGMGLGTMWGKEKAIAMLQEAGFTRIDVQQLEHDFINYYYIVKK